MYKVNSLTYTASSVSANTDITENLIPSNSYGFKIIAFEINCSAAAKIELNDNDSVYCIPAASGYSVSVNIGTDFFVDVEKIKIVDACNINALTVYYSVEGYDEKLNAPFIEPAAGSYPAPLTVNITSLNEGDEIYYSVDGSDPSVLYTEPLTLELGSTTTVKAISTKEGHFIDSDVSSAVFSKAQVATPVADPAAGEVESGTEIELTCETEGAVIKYSTDGGTTYETYTEAIALTEDTTITAKATLEGYTDSATLTAAYTIAE